MLQQINGLERKWKEAVMVQFEVITQQGHEGTEENQANPQSGYLVSWLICEVDIFLIQASRITV
jgi:hypothetical protein